MEKKWGGAQKKSALFHSGFSLIGVLAAAGIGMIVVSGMSQYMIQMKIQSSDQDKAGKRLNIQSFIGRILDDSQACYNTLNPGTLTPAVAATDTAPFPEQKFKIEQLKDSAGNTLLNFEKYKSGDTIPTGKAIGDLKDETVTGEKLRNLGIDKFEKLEFVYDKDLSSLAKIVLHSETKIKGMLERKNPPIVWELSGISVSSNKVTLCAESTPLKILCGTTAVGRPHGNGGGFVEGTATVDSMAYIGKEVVVCGTAKVIENARVFGNAQVTGNATVKGNALVYDNAKISGDATIYGGAKVYDSAQVTGQAQVRGNAQVYNQAQIKDNAQVYNNAKVYGSAQISGNAKVYKGTTGTGPEVYGSAKITDTAQVYNSAKVSGMATIMNGGKVYDNAQVNGQAKVTHTAQVYDNAQVIDSSYVQNTAQVYDNAIIRHSAKVTEQAQVYGNAELNMSSLALGDSKVYGDATMWYLDRP